MAIDIKNELHNLKIMVLTENISNDVKKKIADKIHQIQKSVNESDCENFKN